jgi:hypothetical protein
METVETESAEEKKEEKMEVDASGSKDTGKTENEMDTEMADKDQKKETATSECTTEGAQPFASAGTSGTQSDEGRKELPFQLQVVYTDTEGAKALRVLTHTKPITRDRKKAERSKLYTVFINVIT